MDESEENLALCHFVIVFKRLHLQDLEVVHFEDKSCVFQTVVFLLLEDIAPMLEYHSSKVSRLFLVFIILHKLVQVYILSVQTQETGIPFVLLLNRIV